MKKISYETRKEIKAMCMEGKSPKEIALAIGVNESTIYRELKKGGATKDKKVTLNDYDPLEAQKNYV